MADGFKVTILKDGSIKVTTDAISPENHMNADQFILELQTRMGGDVNYVIQGDMLVHQHIHDVNTQSHKH